jgi:hypothetical protein
MAEDLAEGAPNQTNAHETVKLMPAAVRDCGGLRHRQTSDVGKEIQVSTQLSTQLEILRRRLEETQSLQHWKPEPGDTLLGTLRGLKPAQGPFGQGHMLIIETEGGELWSMWLTAFLKAELEAQGARPGTLVGVKYLGKGISKSSGKTYNRYEVVVQDPLPVVDATELEPPWED